MKRWRRWGTLIEKRGKAAEEGEADLGEGAWVVPRMSRRSPKINIDRDRKSAHTGTES